MTASVVVAAGVSVAVAGSATAAPAAGAATYQRVAGPDRFATAAAAATSTYLHGAATVVLADGTGGYGVDALSAAYLAGSLQAPILLTAATTTPAVTASTLRNLGAKTLWLVGGPAAISDGQAAAFTAAGYTVHRLAGADRYATNEQIVDQPGPGAVGPVDNRPTAILATGADFPDALAAGPAAFAAHVPVVLTTSSELSGTAAAALKHLGITQVVIAGGTASVSTHVEDQLTAMGIRVSYRAAGVDRSDTSRLLADWEIAHSLVGDVTFAVAGGSETTGGVDALGGAPYAGARHEPLLLTNGPTNPGAVITFARAHAPTDATGTITILGGPAAVDPATATAIAAATSNPLPTCTTAQLSPSQAPVVGGLNHVGLVLTFTNQALTCTITGYPSVAGTVNGTAVVQARQTPRGYLGGPGAAPTVTLTPNQSASALLEGLDGPPAGQPCADYTALRITAPNDAQAASLPIAKRFCSPEVHPVTLDQSGGANS